jgi:carbon monoxide dehydrogenase subunit G
MIFETSIDIAAPPAVVWPIMADVERWPEWTATVTSARPVGGGALAVGQRVWVRQPKLPPAQWRVTEIAPGRGFTWVSGAPGARVFARHTIAPAGSGSRVTLTIDYRGPIGALFGWLLRKINRSYLAIEAAGLKARSEALARAGGPS